MDEFDRLYSELCGLRHGGLAGAKASDRTVSFRVLEFHSRAIVGSAKVSLVVDLCREAYFIQGVSLELDSSLRRVTAMQASLTDWLESGRRALVYSFHKLIFNGILGAVLEEDPSIPSYAVVVSAVVLLSLVYQYLTGNVDTGSSKAYSRSSLDFRDIYVAVVLFLGAYVWIKFREVALRGVHKRVYKRGRTPKVVYVARLTPPDWNGEAVPKLDLGQFATEQEAHTKFRIAAFYYNRDAGLLDGWFQVPPMSEEERSLTGLEFRAWVTVQAKKVYEDFKEKEATLLLHELLDNEMMPEQDEVNVDFSVANLLNSAEYQQPALVSPIENFGMDMAMPDNEGLQLCAPHSFGGMHEGVALSNVRSLGFEEGFALPVSHPPPTTESALSVNGNDHWDLLQTLTSEANLLNGAEHHLPLLGSQAENSGMAIDMQPMLDGQGLQCAPQSFGGMHEGFVTSNGHSVGLQEDSAMPISQLPPDSQSGMCMNNCNHLNFPQMVHNLQELITCLRQQVQERDARISVLQNEKRLDRQQLEESRIRISQLESQSFVEQQLQVFSQGVSGFELEQSMFQQNHPCRPPGSAFW